jgi:hypothetical protein
MGSTVRLSPRKSRQSPARSWGDRSSIAPIVLGGKVFGWTVDGRFGDGSGLESSIRCRGPRDCRPIDAFPLLCDGLQ